jgi:transcriptional regulator with XRE-family HTH domain
MEIKGFGSIIRKHRKLKGWDQARLGREVGKSAQIISNWEREVTPPDVLDLFRLAIALEISVDYIVGLSPEPQGSVNLKNDLENVVHKETIYWGDQELTKQQQKVIRKIILAVLEENEESDSDIG